MNKLRKENFNQVCVWPGCQVGEDNAENFESTMKDEMGVRVQYLEEIKTRSDVCNGRTLQGTGGRNDLFFAIHNDDVGKFAVPRLSMGIRWIEDVLSHHNYSSPIYPERVRDYKIWEC